MTTYSERICNMTTYILKEYVICHDDDDVVAGRPAATDRPLMRYPAVNLLLEGCDRPLKKCPVNVLLEERETPADSEVISSSKPAAGREVATDMPGKRAAGRAGNAR